VETVRLAMLWLLLVLQRREPESREKHSTTKK